MTVLGALSYDSGCSLSYAEYGCPGGFPVLVQHGMIASICDGALFARLGTLGARVISMARPGYGLSSPRNMSTIAEWGDMVALLVGALDLQHFDVLGISSGAPYAYAVGSSLSERVRNIFILSGTPALFEPDIAAHWPYPLDRAAEIPELQNLARRLFFSSLTEAERSRNDIRDSMGNDCYGIALDLKLRCRGWGLSLSQITAPVYMQHSVKDEHVPFITAIKTARLLPNCHLYAVEQGDHFSAEVLDGFIAAVMAPLYRGLRRE